MDWTLCAIGSRWRVIQLNLIHLVAPLLLEYPLTVILILNQSIFPFIENYSERKEGSLVQVSLYLPKMEVIILYSLHNGKLARVYPTRCHPIPQQRVMMEAVQGKWNVFLPNKIHILQLRRGLKKTIITLTLRSNSNN